MCHFSPALARHGNINVEYSHLYRAVGWGRRSLEWSTLPPRWQGGPLGHYLCSGRTGRDSREHWRRGREGSRA
jgi:hypothetical protein